MTTEYVVKKGEEEQVFPNFTQAIESELARNGSVKITPYKKKGVGK